MTWTQRYIEFEKLTVDDGLSQNTVYSIAQDDLGFMWFGTQDGLNRYDGHSFKIYRSDSSAKSVPGRVVNHLLMDRDGSLWIGTQGNGLGHLETRTETFTTYLHQPGQMGLSHNMIKGLLQDNSGVLWVGTENGLNTFDRQNNRWRLIDELPHRGVTGLSLDRKGRIWVGTEMGLTCLDPEGRLVRHWGSEALGNHRVRAVLCHRDQVYIGTMEGLESINLETGEHRKDLLGMPIEVDVLFCDSKKVLWIGTPSGLRRLDPNGTVLSYAHSSVDPDSISGNIIRTVFEDRGGTKWVGTEASGVNKIQPYSEIMTHIQKGRGLEHGLEAQIIIYMHRDRKGRFWITSDGTGLTQFDPKTGHFSKPYLVNPDDPSKGPSDNYLWTISEDDRGRFWIPSRNGVNLFNPDTGQWRHYFSDPNQEGSLGDNRCFTACLDKSGRLWVGTFGGGLSLLLDEETGQFRTYRLEPNRSNSLSSDHTLYVDTDSRGRLWVGTFGQGLNLYRAQSDDFLRFLHDPDDPNSLPEDSVGHIYEDRKGLVWFSTGGGIARLREATFDFEVFDHRHGLEDDVTYAMIEDERGYLWVSTNTGLSRFDSDKRHFVNFNIHHNLQSKEFNQASCYYHEGTMYFGGVNGFNMFDPEALHRYDVEPRTVLTELRIFNKPRKLERPIEYSDHLELSHKDRMVSFRVAGLDYLAPEMQSYSYLLEGFSDEPIETREQTITFTNLEPGDYTLKLKTINPDGKISRQETVVAIEVIPPPWRTPYAYVFWVVLIVSFIYLGWRFQQSRLERERRINKRLQTVDRLKDEFLANTSHELRTPLSGIVGIAESLLEGAAGPVKLRMRENLNLIVNNGRRLDNLISDLLDFSQMKHNTLNLEFNAVDMAAVAEVTVAMFKNQVDRKPIRLESGVSHEMPYVRADENRLQQILFNLLSNAIKFTREGFIRIEADIVNGRLQLGVRDSGIGIPKDRQEEIFNSFQQLDGSTAREFGGAGLGLAVTRQLVALHHSELQVSSEEGKGSFFYFSLPLADKRDQAQPHTKTELLRRELNKELEEESKQEATENTRFHILIVDDERVNRQILKNLLRVKGYQITVANDGAEALALIFEKEIAFDLMLLDVMMPRVTGYDVCREVRIYYSLQELPIIFLTAKNQASELRTGFEMGANDYLTKPFSKDELLSRVHMHLSLLDMTRNLENLVEERTQSLALKNRELETIDSIVRAINQEIQIEELLNTILEQAIRLFPQAESGSMLVLTPTRREFYVGATVGYDIDVTKNVRLSLEQARQRYTVGTEELIEGIYIIRDPDEGTRPKQLHVLPKPQALLAMQIVVDGTLQGYMVLDHSSSTSAFSQDDVERLMRLREHATTALARALMVQSLEETQRDLVEAAHLFGMADNAALVLHNMGNKLNSVNTSTQVLRDRLSLARWLPVMERTQLLLQTQDDLLKWLADNPAGKQFPTVLGRLFGRIATWRNDVSEELRRLENHVGEVLDVLRAQWDYTAIKSGTHEPADLNKLVQACTRQLLANHGSGIELETTLQPLPVVVVPKMKVMRVFFCLVENAIEAIESKPDKQGVIRLNSFVSGHEVVIELIDDGIGFDSAVGEQLFTHGFTTKSSFTVGFGLHNCANAISELEGQLTVTSAGQGQGAVARIRIPCQGPF